MLPDSFPGALHSILGRMGIVLVDSKKPQLIGSELSSENDNTIIVFGDPATGVVSHKVSVANGARISQAMENIDE
jgi:hypothetical protein